MVDTKKESAPAKKHISYQDWFDFESPLNIESMLCRQFIYSPNYLLEILHKAYDFYTSTPGENLEYRRQNADLWLGNIRTLLQERNVRFDTTFPLMHSPVVLDYHTLVSCIGQGYDFWNKQLKRYPAI